MAFGNATFANASAAVQDIFQSQAQAGGLRIQAGGMRITAEGTRIGAESTRIGAEATRLRARGLDVEAENYGGAAALADQNLTFAETSTRIQRMMAERTIQLGLGDIRSDVAGAGFAEGGSSGDILRASAAQGALQKALVSAQGMIQEEGYREQGRAYRTLQGYSTYAAGVERDIATRQEGVAARQDFLALKQDELARKYDDLADDTESAGGIMAGVHALSSFATLLYGGPPGLPGGGE